MKSGDSISLQCRFGKGEDVCTVNAEGTENGYMVNTFSVPDAVISPPGDHALYTCSAGTSDSAYAQCDCGLCFTSTEGKSFPGFGAPPIARADRLLLPDHRGQFHHGEAGVSNRRSQPLPEIVLPVLQ